MAAGTGISISNGGNGSITIGQGGHITVSNYTSTSATATTGWYNTSTTGGSGLTVSDFQDVIKRDPTYVDGDVKVKPNSELHLPDGSVLKVDSFGNFKVLDDKAIVTHKGNNTREFNKFINASDLLEAFIKDLGDLGVKQHEVLDVPIEMFINWLIFKAAEEDGDDAPTDVPLLESSVTPHKHPKCLCCGRFIKKKLVEHKIHFCNPKHHERYLERISM